MTVDRGTVDTKLDRFLSNKGATSKGRVFVLDLTAIKDQIGPEWDRLMSRVHLTSQSVIEKRLSDADLSEKWDDETFLIAFGHLDQARARIKVNLIAQEISMRLLGSKDKSNAVLVSMADTDDDGNLTWNKHADAAKLISKEAKTNTAKPISSEPEPLQSPVFSGDVKFIFRPLWFIKNQIISSYCCIPIRNISDGRFSSSYSVIDDAQNLNAIKALDMLTAKNVFKEARRLEEENNPALLTLPLHFESLASTQRKTDLVAQCQKNLKPFSKRIVTELVHLPEGIPQSRLQELVQSVKPFSRAVMARFKLDHKDFASYRNIGVFAVGADIFEDKRSESEILAEIEKFATLAEKSNLSTYVHGIRTTSMATAAICSGIDYIDGYAVSAVSDQPADVKMMTLRDNYEAKFKQLYEAS